jgi:hypothetical protein
MKIENVKEVIERYQLDKKNRKREVIYIRSILYTQLRNEKWTLAQIGKLFNKDHATILHGLRCYQENIKYQDFKDINNRIEQELNLATQEIEPESKLQLTEIELDILEANNITQFYEIKNNLIKKLSIKE